ncbi:hypothetical protein, partial [Streptomyces edwardsiae]
MDVALLGVDDGSGTLTLVGALGVSSVWSCCPPQATASTAEAAIAVSPATRPVVVDPRFITPPTSVFYDGGKSGEVAREYRT